VTAALYLAAVRGVARDVRGAMEKMASAFPERARKISSLAREADRLRSLAAGLLLHKVLGAPEILYGEWGKPYAAGGPHFNLSHSGDCVALAVDDEPVGVDLEKWIEEDYHALSRVSFNDDERAAFERDPTAGTFFGIWTLRESYMKMRGAGFSMDPTSFGVRIRGHEARIVSDPGFFLFLRLYDLEGYSMALCSSHRNWPENFKTVVL
jgi:4'-phosphopantetheinyl transferase